MANAGGTVPGWKSAQAKAAAHTKWSMTDGIEGTAAARAAFLARFEKQVDPEGKLSPQERAKRAESARRAHMSKLSAAAAKARAAKRAAAA